MPSKEVSAAQKASKENTDEDGGFGTGDLVLVDKASDIRSGDMGKGYFITPEDKLVDITGDFGAGTNDHVGYMVASDHGEKLGVDKKILDKFTALNDALYGEDGAFGSNKLGFTDDEIDTLEFDWSDAYADMWQDIYEGAGLVRVREFAGLAHRGGKRQIAIDGIPDTRRGVGRLQDLVLQGQITSDKNAVYSVETLGFGGNYTFDWNKLMMARYPRDLKDDRGHVLCITLRSLVA
jgi:hypothetical protein